MADKLDAVKIKQQRGRLLTNLNLFYPSPVQLKTLYLTVCYDPTYTRIQFQKDIYYFAEADKAYIEFVDDAIGGMDEFMDKVVTLTGRGKEIAEGTRTDPALEI